MYYLKTESFNSEDPVYMKLNGGDKTFFFPEARVAKDYFNTGLYERNFISWSIENFLKEDKCVIDIGAHCGIYTVEYAKHAKHVYSFECSPKSFNYLCANIALRDINYNVTKYNVGLSDCDSVIPYYIRDPKDGGGNGISKFKYDDINNTPSIDVPVKTLDSFNLTNINFIKIDVEGHELQVLKGAVNTLKNNNYPKFMFESWPDRQENNNFPARQLRAELFAFIESLGYKIVPLMTDDMFLAEYNR
jgi:FkbM family methyltransferase